MKHTMRKRERKILTSSGCENRKPKSRNTREHKGFGVKTVGPLQSIGAKTVDGPKDWSGPTV